MDLGICFDDEDFETKKMKERKPLTSYNAKVCHPLWFQERNVLEDDEALIHRLKYDGDHKFYQNKYRDAVIVYKQALGLMYSNPNIVHDIKESLCRCYSKLMQHEEASKLAEELLSKSQNEDQKIQVLTLINYVYKEANNIQGEIQSLKYLIQLTPFREQLWISLAERLQHKPTQINDISVNDSHYAKLVIFTCLMRARLLVVYSLKQTDSFCKEKNLDFQNKVEKMIADLQPEKDCIDYLTKILKKELAVSHENSEDSQNRSGCTDSINIVSEFSEEEFDKYWFKWIHKYESIEKT